MTRSARDYSQQNDPHATKSTISTSHRPTLRGKNDHDYSWARRGQKNHRHRSLMKSSQILFNLYLVYLISSHLGTPKSNPRSRSILSHSQVPTLESISPQNRHHDHKDHHSQENHFFSTNRILLFADASLTLECENDIDCDGNGEKICHENKCICNKDRPIEAGGACLAMQLIDEPCQVDGQCMGGSQCLDDICSCGPDGISAKNPSLGILYCHPKRQLNEVCNYDTQCPQNSYCSDKCLCLNGFAPANIKTSPDGPELFSCLPITCNDVSQCESSEFYQCEDNKCKCLPTHFDPTRARCYRFGSLRMGNSTDDESQPNNKTLDDITMENNTNNMNNQILLILNDLIGSTTGRADLFWLLLIVILCTLALVITLCCCKFLCCKRRSDVDHVANGHDHRRSCLLHLLPCCFIGRKHHQEWDPTDAKAAPPDGAAFLHEENKRNNVNQKSFRRKKNLDSNGDSADEYDDVVAKNDNNNNNNNNNSNNGTKKSDKVSQNASKNNDYQVIYFGDQKRKKLSQTVEETENSLQEDGQFRINMINGIANGGSEQPLLVDAANNGLGKKHPVQNGTRSKLTLQRDDNDATKCNLSADYTNVPTNSTLV